MGKEDLESQRQPCQVWSRIVGYMRPVQDWNKGKREEYRDRKVFNVNIIKKKVESDNSLEQSDIIG